MPRITLYLAGLTLVLLLGEQGRSDFKEVAPELQRGNPQFIAAFREAVNRPSKATVRVLCDGKETALGVVVGGDGWILTKAHDLHGHLACKLRDSRFFEAQLVGVHTAHDLALLKIATRGLAPVEFRDSKTMGVGNWVVCVGPGDEPAAIGILSVATRTVPPRSANKDHGYLGVAVEHRDGALRISQVMPDTPAARAGLQPQDVLLSVQGQALASTDAFIDTMQQHKVGELVTVRILRGKEELQVQATLIRRPSPTRGDFQNRMGSELSSRITGYTTILQHDAVIRPRDCGGPVVDLDGKVIGLNICRAGRTESWAIPSEVILSVLPDLMSGRLPAKGKP